MLGELVFRHTDQLATSLQSSSLTASGGRQMAENVMTVLAGLRTDDHFDMFYSRVKQQQDKLGKVLGFEPLCDPL